jgi:hypothetical protein
MSTHEHRRCDGTLPDGSACPNMATHSVRVSTMPGSFDGKLITLRFCHECYDAGDWAEVDLTGGPWELALRDAGGA